MIEIQTYSPYDIDGGEWRDLHSLARTAFRVDLMGQRTEAEIDELVGWDDSARYIASHLDPNNERGERYNANQDFRDPRVAVAKNNGELIGFGYIANNVSGETQEIRDHKYRTLVKRYAWIREVVVDPNYRQQQVATKIGATLLRDKSVHPLQPVSTYIWPDMFPHHQSALERLGFAPTGSAEDHPFGESNDPTTLTRMQARWVYGVSRHVQRRLR
jgi:hypothetical protein